MKKLMGTIRVKPNVGSETSRPHFEITFVPYAERVNAQIVRVNTHDDLVAFLMGIKLNAMGLLVGQHWRGRTLS